MRARCNLYSPRQWDDPLEIVFGRHDGDHPNGRENLMDKHNRIRKAALAGGYDALFMVEADILLPEDAIKRLAAVDTDVAYGLYCSRHPNYQWLAFSELNKNTGKSYDHKRKWCVANWGKVIETKGVGMGCTFIHRNVLEQIEFRLDGGCADDWYFSMDCQAKGFRQHHDLGVACGHIIRDGKPRIIWPTVSDPNALYEFEFLREE